MLLGYNHNITYKGLVFHIQTEDSGTRKPHITTLLYRDGVILCSQKTSYTDILTIENLESIVEDLMKEQHKSMLRRLKNGEFDHKTGTTADLQQHEKAVSPTENGLSSPPVAIYSETSATKQNDTSRTETTSRLSAVPDASQERTECSNLDEEIRAFFGITRLQSPPIHE